MDDINRSEDALFELLTIERVEREGRWPNFNVKVSDPVVSSFTWLTASKKSLKKDIHYLDKDGLPHRIYGPCYISLNYDVEIWRNHGVLHRIGGPAIRHKNDRRWYVDGKLHREDGPAVETPAGPKEYWLDGNKLSPKEYKREIERRKNGN